MSTDDPIYNVCTPGSVPTTRLSLPNALTIASLSPGATVERETTNNTARVAQQVGVVVWSLEHAKYVKVSLVAPREDATPEEVTAISKFLWGPSDLDINTPQRPPTPRLLKEAD